ESERDGRAPNHGVVPVSDAGTDRQRCGERAEHQRGRHQQQDDGENPPATLQHRGQPVVAGQGLAHQGILSRVLRPAAQAISRTIRNQLQRLSGLLSALANGFLGGEPPLRQDYATIIRGKSSCWQSKRTSSTRTGSRVTLRLSARSSLRLSGRTKRVMSSISGAGTAPRRFSMMSSIDRRKSSTRRTSARRLSSWLRRSAAASNSRCISSIASLNIQSLPSLTPNILEPFTHES